MSPLRVLALLPLLFVVAASCGDDSAGDDPVGEAGADDDATGLVVDGPAPGVDLSLDRSDVDCSPEAVGDDIEFTTVHVVVDGVLGAPCLGNEDATLYAAWEVLVAIAPESARADLGLFGGFGLGADDSGETTLAFVNPIDDDGTLFQMSINLDTYEDDENEALLTVAHEFSHVFTLGPSQIDRATLPDECDTFDNGEGCFFDDALMAQWVDLFWTDDMLADFNPNAEATNELGEDRCDLNPEFLGPYAASSPDEDFAETFAAFVFELDVDPALDPKIEWMGEQPGLVEFRERAEASGLGPLDNNFELCG